MQHLLNTGLFVLLLFVSSNGISQITSKEKKAVATDFIKLVQDKDWESIGKIINYPYERDYPIADIQNAAEFLARRKELFDDSLTLMISNSSVDSSFWLEIDSTGMLFENGGVRLDQRGKLISIDYITEASVILTDKLIELDRSTLPSAFQEYERPILQMETEKFLIRIDELKGPSFRLIAWHKGVRNPNRPAVEIVPNGILQHFGSNGDYSYKFESDVGDFVCYISEFKEDGSLPADLLLYRDDVLVRVYRPIWLTY